MYYSYFRNSFPIDDTLYLKKILEEVFIMQYNILAYFENILEGIIKMR